MLLTIRYEIARDSERRIEEMTEQKINFLNLDFFFFEKLVIWICEFFFFFWSKGFSGKIGNSKCFLFWFHGSVCNFFGEGGKCIYFEGKIVKLLCVYIYIYNSQIVKNNWEGHSPPRLIHGSVLTKGSAIAKKVEDKTKKTTIGL